MRPNLLSPFAKPITRGTKELEFSEVLHDCTFNARRLDKVDVLVDVIHDASPCCKGRCRQTSGKAALHCCRVEHQVANQGAKVVAAIAVYKNCYYVLCVLCGFIDTQQ